MENDKKNLGNNKKQTSANNARIIIFNIGEGGGEDKIIYNNIK